MSTRFDILYNIAEAKLQQNAVAMGGWAILSVALFGTLLFWSLMVDARMPKLPIAMQEEVPDRKQRIDIFIKDTRRLLIDSYNKRPDADDQWDSCFGLNKISPKPFDKRPSGYQGSSPEKRLGNISLISTILSTTANSCSSCPESVNMWGSSRTRRESSLAQIHIDHHFESKVYTSGSEISGHVALASRPDAIADALEIVLLGTIRTNVYAPQSDVPPARHTFLQLSMASLPGSRALNPEEPCRVPFHCVMPYQLPGIACKFAHGTMVHQRHLQLPPTMGAWQGDDQAPRSARVEYAIKATVILKSDQNETERSIDFFRQLLVLPFHPEQPPFHNLSTNIFRLSQSAMIRRDFFSSKIGSLRAAAIPSDPIVLSTETLQASQSSITLDLEFVPLCNRDLPPDIQVKSANIRAITHYSESHISYLPGQEERLSGPMSHPVINYFDSSELVYSQPGKPLWHQEPVSRMAHNPGGVMDESRFGFRAPWVIPFTLPTASNNIFLPSFYSCLIARTHIIDITLSVGSFGTSLSLTIPLQISARGSADSPNTELPDYVSENKPRPAGSRADITRQSQTNPQQALTHDMPPPYHEP
ncbi:hypothetical protein ACJ41O_012478 [Fusarium nematophilum]